TADEIPSSAFHHDGSPAGVYLVPRKIRVVLQYGLVHKPGATVPAIRCLSVGHHRHIAEIGQVGGPFHRLVVHVQIAWAASTPVQDRLALVPGLDHALDDGLDGGKARAAREENNRFIAIVTQEE